MVKTTERESQNSPQEDKHNVIRKPKNERQFRKRMDGLILWQYLLDLLMCSNWQPYIRWTGNKLEFLLIDGVVVFTEFQQRKWQNADPTPIGQDPGERWKDCLITKEDVKNRLRGLCSEYYKRNAEERDNKPLIEKRIGMKGGYAFMSHKSICERVGLDIDALLKYTEDVGRHYEYPATTRIFKEKKETSNGSEECYSEGSNTTTVSSSQKTLESSPTNLQPHSVEDPIPDDFGLFRPPQGPLYPNLSPAFSSPPQLPPVSSMQPSMQPIAQPQLVPQFPLPTQNFHGFPNGNQFFRGPDPYVEQDSLCPDGYRGANGYSGYGTSAQYARYEQPTQLFAQPSAEYFAQPCAEYQYTGQSVGYEPAIQPTGYPDVQLHCLQSYEYTDYRSQYQYPDYESDCSYYSCDSSRPDTPSSTNNQLERYDTPLPFESQEEDRDMEMLSATLTLASLVSDFRQPRPNEPPSPITDAINNDPFPVDVLPLDTILENAINYKIERKELTL